MFKTAKSQTAILKKIRWVLGFFILALILSGITAFPLQQELELGAKIRGIETFSAESVKGFDHWILVIRDGLRESYSRYPWIAYGTDWLAFAHIIIAIFFIGPFINPIRNISVLYAGLVACALIIPLALICGEIRHIPLGWRMIDCSFGILGALPLIYCVKLTKRLERASTQSSQDQTASIR